MKITNYIIPVLFGFLLAGCSSTGKITSVNPLDDEVYFQPSDIKLLAKKEKNSETDSRRKSRKSESYTGSYSDRLRNFGGTSSYYPSFSPGPQVIIMSTFGNASMNPGYFNNPYGMYGYNPYYSPFSPYYGYSNPYNNMSFGFGYGNSFYNNNPYYNPYNPYNCPFNYPIYSYPYYNNGYNPYQNSGYSNPAPQQRRNSAGSAQPSRRQTTTNGTYGSPDNSSNTRIYTPSGSSNQGSGSGRTYTPSSGSSGSGSSNGSSGTRRR